MPRRPATAVAPAPKPEAVASARAAGLRYVRDDSPGIRRMNVGGRFRYVLPSGRAVGKHDQARIDALAIPPAWRDVWVCPDPAGHVQAVGRDARGRKQYRYHPDWSKARDGTKYERMFAFVRALPGIRRAVARDMARPGLPRGKVLATVVRLLEATLIRVGNDEYARANRSYGLTTLRDRHARVRGATVDFRFRGKAGVGHAVDLRDPRLARIVRQCQDLPGEELFQYVDETGAVCDVGSADVNEYLRRVGGDDFTAKDFRTWAGTVLAARALREVERVGTAAARKRNIVAAVEAVAKRLGNTTAVCRKCYIHPGVFDAYLDGTLAAALSRKAGRELAGRLTTLRPEEAAVLALLQRRLARDAAAATRRRVA